MHSTPALAALALTLTATAPAVAQEPQHDHDHGSPYASFTDREIKALSNEEIEGLLNGDGLGMALPAELNGYPGPKHVLELAPMLELSAEQESRIRAVYDEMKAEAEELGEAIVDLERELDQAFAGGTITESRLDELLAEIAAYRGRLRAAHLRAHLRVLPILSETQRKHYDRARGYAG